jgi:hypothetical protein
MLLITVLMNNFSSCPKKPFLIFTLPTFFSLPLYPAVSLYLYLFPIYPPSATHSHSLSLSPILSVISSGLSVLKIIATMDHENLREVSNGRNGKGREDD